MAYATQDDLVPLRMTVGDLAELTSETDTPDPLVVQAALDEASGRVDSYCGQRYKTPLQTSVLVKSMTLDIAIYILQTRRRDTKLTETVTQNFNFAMSMLRDVSTGKASLDTPANAAEPQSSSSGVTVTGKRQIFDECNLKGFC
jgi:phage gp36-like protein